MDEVEDPKFGSNHGRGLMATRGLGEGGAKLAAAVFSLGFSSQVVMPYSDLSVIKRGAQGSLVGG